MSQYLGELTVHDGEDRAMISAPYDSSVVLDPSAVTLAATFTPTDDFTAGFSVADGAFTKTSTGWTLPLSHANLDGRGGQRLRFEVRRTDSGYNTVLNWGFLYVRKAA